MRKGSHRKMVRRGRGTAPECLLLMAMLLLLGAASAAVLSPGSDVPSPPAVQSDPLADQLAQSVASSGGSLTPPVQKGYVPGRDPEPSSGDWALILVNAETPLPENCAIQTVTLSNNLQVDLRCYPDLQAMMDACRAEGLSPVICSAYRTQEYQERLYRAETERWLERGYSQSDAEEEAGKSVAVPGTSEHQLGLAVDIVDMNNQRLDESQERTDVQIWLMAHSWEYGFILRYPSGKSEITGIIYEPWHYRYVGREHAERIDTLNVCLEEYLSGAF